MRDPSSSPLRAIAVVERWDWVGVYKRGADLYMKIARADFSVRP